MQSFSLSRWMPALALGVALLGATFAAAADPYDRVNFDTADGVKLQGYYWPGKNGNKSPTVLMLHNFDTKKGGTALDDGWGDLAKALQDKGYAVLAFDFRGHGQSTSINKEFWTIPHNAKNIKGFTPVVAKQANTIAFTSFHPAYYNYFVNDIVAARAYLDGLNDANELNMSQLIVIGAGEGATLGSMWMAAEWHRRRAIPPKVAIGLPSLNQYRLVDGNEGSDQACAIWLSISPTLAGVNKPVSSWLLKVAGAENKVPMVFVYGSKDKSNAEHLADAWLTKLVPGYMKGKPSPRDYQYTGEKAIDTMLSGSKLLDPQLDTTKFLMDSYIEPLIKKGQPAWRKRDYANSAYLYVFPGKIIPAKMETDMLPRSFPLSAMGVTTAAGD